jgi:hypothetical protein
MGNGAVVSSHRSNNRAARLRTKVNRALFPTQKLRSPNSSSMPEDGSSQSTVRAGRQKTTLSIVVMLSGLSLRTRKLKYLSQTYEPNFMTNDPRTSFSAVVASSERSCDITDRSIGFHTQTQRKVIDDRRFLIVQRVKAASFFTRERKRKVSMNSHPLCDRRLNSPSRLLARSRGLYISPDSVLSCM